MNEFIIVELVCVFFLALHVLSPLHTWLSKFTRLIHLPTLAFFILVCTIAAYGFRPELLPLILFAAAASILLYKWKKHKRLEYRKVPLMLLLFCISCAVAFYFKPSQVLIPSNTKTYTMEGTDLLFRIYPSRDSNSPTLILFPTSLHSVDSLASQAQKRGFTVFSFAQPTKNMLKNLFKHFYAMLFGHSFVSANKYGVQIEEQWRDYIIKALVYLEENELLGESFFIAGYQEAGSASVFLSTEKDFTDRFPALKGIIALEGRLWFAYGSQERPLIEIPSDSGLIQIGWYTIVNRFTKLLPPKLILNHVQAGDFPVLFLTAAKIRRDSLPYQAVIEYARSGSSSIIAVPGASVLDYSDYPARYPIISALSFGGFKTLWRRDDFVVGTAALFANFASQWVERGLLKQVIHTDQIYVKIN